MSERPLPPHQVVTSRWPRIGEREPEPFDAAAWTLEVTGRVARPFTLRWDELASLPHETRAGDLHCVTRWSRLRIAFRGVPVSALLDRAGLLPSARFVRFASGRGHDTSLPLGRAAAEILVADGVHMDGDAAGPFAAIPAENGGPVRTVVFDRYLYKSVKWLRRIEVLDEDRLGFWERTAGYHNEADPWREQRYVAAGVDGGEMRRRMAARDLAGMDLRSADLRGADLAGARLAGASLRNVVLEGADLRGADLTGANCTNAVLRGSDLRGARIDGIDLDGADLRGADLRGATGRPASMAVAQFRAAPGDPAPDARVDGLDWRGARLDGLLADEEAWLRSRGVV